MLRPDLLGGDQPLVGVGRRHADVDYDCRPAGLGRPSACSPSKSLGLAYDLEAGVTRAGAQCLPA